MSTRRPMACALVAALIPPLVVACETTTGPDGDGDADGQEPFAGSYWLKSINGDAVPATLTNESGPGCDQRILGGSMTLNEDLTFSATSAGYDVPRAPAENLACDDSWSDRETGSFQIDGTSLTFTTTFYDATPPVAATVADGVLTFNLPGEEGSIALRFENGGTDQAASMAGTYSLLTIDGEQLPVVEYEDDEVIEELMSVSASVTQGGTCAVTVTTRETDKQTQATSEDTESSTSCSYVVSGSNMAMTMVFPEDDPFTLHGTFSGSETLTFTDDDGAVLVFQK